MGTISRIRKAGPSTRLIVAAVVACSVFAGVDGFAASLGTSASALGADSAVVGSCGSGMTLDYTVAFYNGSGGHAVDGIDLSGIPAGCLGKNLSVTFYDSEHGAVGSAVDTALPASGATETVPVAPSSNTIEASRISGVSVVVW